jgi:hypothetical protein
LVTEVLDAPNADGRYYNIAPLEAEGAGGTAGPIEEFEGELTVDGWVGNEAPYTQTVVVDELSDYNNCAITLSSSATEEQMYAAALAEINDISYNENNNTITFVANGEKPTVVIPFTVCAGQSMNVVEIPNYLGQEIPTNHASATTTYGTGSVANYGHVKVSDSYKTSDGAASAGVAASSKAVSDAYNEINSNLNIFPDYANCVQLLNHDVIPNDTVYNYTVTETAYYYVMAYSDTSDMSPYVRVSCSNTTSWAFSGEKKPFSHITSPLFLLKKGTVIQIVVIAPKRLLCKIPICTDIWEK